jgi:MFS family permease
MQVGGIAGPILGGWIAGRANLSIVFRYSAALFLVSTVVVFFLKPAMIQEGQETSQGLKLSPFANPRILALLAAVFFTIFALNLPTQLASLYLQNEHHLSIQQIGITGTIGSIGTALIMVVLGNLRAPAGMLAGQLLMAVFSLFLWRGKDPALFFSAYLFAGGTRLYHSMALAFARPLVRLSQVGLAYGLVETGNALAIILAPLAAGALYDHQPELVFIVCLFAIPVTITMNLLLSFQRNQKGEQSP